MQRSDLDNRFDFHPADGLTAPRHEQIREAAKRFAAEIDAVCGVDSREKSLAITATEEAMMWANAAIARNR